MRKLTIDEIIEKAEKIHNGKYDYSELKKIELTKASNTIVPIICPEHGIFYQKVYNHLSGYGCTQCYNDKRSIIRRKSNEEFIKECQEKYSNFNYTFDKTKYTLAKSMVTVTCPIHGDFKRKACELLQGIGCPKCKKELLYEKQKEIFINKSKLLHNYFYTYDKVSYHGNKAPVCITCPIHGDFWQKPNDHIDGHGCPICGNTNKTELEIKEILIKNFKNVTYQQKFDWLRYKNPLYYDFYLPDYNVAIEYQGRQHFIKLPHLKMNTLEKTINRDLAKIKCSKENNVKLYHLSYETKYIPKDFNYYHVYDNLDELIKIIKDDQTTI